MDSDTIITGVLDASSEADARGEGSDRVVRDEARRRRTFAIISHPDAGKTTLTEKLLLYAGQLQVAGMVRGRKNQRAVTSDWMELERQRGISVTSAVLSVEYRGLLVNLLDTPGHEDFSEDTYRTLMAADCAVMVLDATKGVEPQTVKLFQVCARRKIPILTFVNKMDRPGSDPLGILTEIERVLGIGAAPLNWPLGTGHSFRGICDRRSREFVIFDPDARGSLVVATERGSLDDKGCTLLTPEERDALRSDMDLLEVAGEPFELARFLQGGVTPVYFGSALSNYGVEAFLDGFLELCPPPGPRASDQGPIPPERPEFSGFVFKLQANMDPRHRDQVAFLRVCSGRFLRDMEVVNARTGAKLRLSRSHRLFAQDRETTDEAFPGDIIGLSATGNYRLGDTLYAGGTPLQYEPLPQFTPEHFARLECVETKRRKHFDKGLTQLVEEGAVQLLVVTSVTQRDVILAAVGQLQFDVVQARLETEYGVKTRLEPLAYRVARRVTTEPDLDALPRSGRGSVQARDRAGRLVMLFGSAWEFQNFCKHHPEVAFEPVY